MRFSNLSHPHQGSKPSVPELGISDRLQRVVRRGHTPGWLAKSSFIYGGKMVLFGIQGNFHGKKKHLKSIFFLWGSGHVQVPCFLSVFWFWWYLRKKLYIVWENLMVLFVLYLCIIGHIRRYFLSPFLRTFDWQRDHQAKPVADWD